MAMNCQSFLQGINQVEALLRLQSEWEKGTTRNTGKER